MTLGLLIITATNDDDRDDAVDDNSDINIVGKYEQLLARNMPTHFTLRKGLHVGLLTRSFSVDGVKCLNVGHSYMLQ